MATPRAEYPRPQFQRKEWLCLNGWWQFEMDPGDSGLERGLLERELQQKILVPYCPESRLSGIENVDFMNAVWYRREVSIPEEWDHQKILLHFGAIDDDATIWVNGKEVSRHRGGWSPFTCDLSGVAAPGEKAVIVVRARDDHQRPKAMGKQSHQYHNEGCYYTRTTGIWQTVWMEPVPEVYLKRTRITPNLANCCFWIEQPIAGRRAGLIYRATLSDSQGEITSSECDCSPDFTPRLKLDIPPDRLRHWSIEEPHLYDLKLVLVDSDGKILDEVQSYCGLRSIAIDGKAVKINGKSLFQRLVLDQGYYPNGLLTAPTDEALEKDIELSLAAGFNGARLHQKVFEERFLYHADRMGYLVWGEFGDWGCNHQGYEDNHQKPGPDYITQWLEVLERDYSHPSIIGWCPLNETYQKLSDRMTVLDDVTRGLFLATKAMDATRPVIDASGYSHRVAETDIYDSHLYEQNPEKFRSLVAGLSKGEPFINTMDTSGTKISFPYGGQPFFISEFGGIWWNPEAAKEQHSWGYGERPASIEEFYERFEGLCTALLDHPDMFGYCYTQLTDVFQEQNGIFSFDRQPKFDMERLRKVQQRLAAIEKLES